MNPWSGTEEEAPFKGLPPLPKVFREPGSSLPPCLPSQAGQEAAKMSERRCSSLQESISRLHVEMRRVRQEDLALFNQLQTLALEIQDLKELQQEIESLSKEEPFAEDPGQAGEDASLPAHLPSSGVTAAFELTI